MANGPSSGGSRPPQRSGPGGRSFSQRPRKKFQHRKKVCRYCANSELKVDYKDAKALRPFLTERGKIVPRRISGTCAKHQREVCTAIKRARVLAIVPFTSFTYDSWGGRD